MQIDAHQHFWNPARGDYGWMPADNATLNRTYGPADLQPHLQAAGIDATVLVQAAPSVEESEYLLGIADATPFVAAVTGWVDFERQEHGDILQRLARHPKFKAVRPMIQDIADDDWMLRGDVQWAYRLIADLGLRFEALGFPRHLDNFLTILTRYPQMPAVVNHCMKPQIRQADKDHFRLWARGISRIARETGAFCKFSALVTEANADWQVEDLRPYVDHVFEAFGPQRVMWGSDWPVCRLRSEYDGWRAASLRLTSALDSEARKSIFGATAKAFYGLSL